mgnify:CR=1 FL=1|tara:strand:- start:3261 stop:4460 length:1200 start_codon:yes stop_codon:yes gene_type:complete
MTQALSTPERIPQRIKAAVPNSAARGGLRTVAGIVLLILIGFFVGVLSGCSRNHQAYFPDLAQRDISREDLLSGRSLWGEAAEELVLPEDHVMRMSPQMRAFLDRYVPGNYADPMKIRAILEAIISPGALGMEYDRSLTFTARESFRRAEGNCLGFSYVFVLLARERGLKAYFQEVEIPPDWTPAAERLVFVNRHINVRVDTRIGHDMVVDIDRANVKPFYPVRRISDKEAEAHYYSNKGAEYLDRGNMKNAFRYFVKAVRLMPKSSAFWSNLGVFYRLNNLPWHAEKAYFIALKYKPSNYSVMTNLAILYEIQGEVEKAEYFTGLAKRYQQKNPYYHYYRAQEAYNDGDYQATLRHLRGVIRQKIEDYRFYDLMAEAYIKLGKQDEAEEVLAKGADYR